MGFSSGYGFTGGGSGGGGTYSIVGVVANYSALPSPASATNKFYWVENSQGTAWLPFSLGGTYYNNGLYYSNGVSWEYMDVPYQATQLEVNTGTNNDKFVTPATLKNLNGSFNRKIYNYLNTDSTHTGSTNEVVISNLQVDGGVMGANGKLVTDSVPFKVGTLGNATFRRYVSTVGTNTVGATGTPASSTQIGTNILAATNLISGFQRELVNKNSESSNTCYPSGTSATTDFAVSTSARTTVNINTANNFWVVDSVQLGNSGDTAGYDNIQLYIEKP